uniref:Heat shock factor-binding protein 1 n=1 Tax=Oncorhynchus kisutch TaxID=8019 RepID=A0A8C7MNQ4_ONCKI
MTESNSKAAKELTEIMEATMQNLQSKFQSILPLTNPLDDMGTRIDDLEKNVADLMTQAGMDEQQTPK